MGLKDRVKQAKHKREIQERIDRGDVPIMLPTVEQAEALQRRFKRRQEEQAAPPRTVADFVREAVERGKSLEQIRAVASASRWASHMPEVMAELEKYPFLKKEIEGCPQKSPKKRPRPCLN